MKYTFLHLYVLLLFFNSCTNSTKNYEELNLKYDSIVNVNTTAQNTINSLEEVVIIIDSIELGYEDISFDLEIGTDYNNYSEKIKKIATYIENAEMKIIDLENMLGNDVSFITSIRKELSLKTQKIEELENAVEDLKAQNEKLFDLIMVQSQTLHSKTVELELKKQEIALIEAHVDELLKVAKVNEAKSFFARAEAIEEAANRTKLAPRKKKETLREALNLYKLSLESGNVAATAKIKELEERLN